MNHQRGDAFTPVYIEKTSLCFKELSDILNSQTSVGVFFSESYQHIQTPPLKPYHYETNTAGISEHICNKRKFKIIHIVHCKLFRFFYLKVTDVRQLIQNVIELK